MHLQTTLILSSSNFSFKTNQRSQFTNFSHPLKVLQKTDNEMLEMLRQHDEATSKSYGFNTQQKFQSTKGSMKEKNKKSKTKTPEYFNEDEGILQHIYNHTQSFSKTFNPKQTSFHPMSTKQCNWLKSKPSEKEPKCTILFGFSINLLEIHNFQTLHPELNLNIKLYQYGDNEYFREVEIKNLEEEPLEQNPAKYQKIIDALNGEELLDCEEVSFVISYWENVQQISQEDYNNEDQENRQKKKTFIYFFPNINALKSEEQRRQERTQLTLGLPVSSTTPKQGHRRKNSVTTNQNQTPLQTMTSLRKSHQNFRILQVLEYYLKLECHSDHIMITSNESRIIKDFMELIYESSIKEFFVYIDHERKAQNRTSKSTVRSILANKYAKDQCKGYDQEDSFELDEEEKNQLDYGRESPPLSKVYTSDICSQKDFISIDGKLIINDQFLSKLSQLKMPEPWLDSVEFREQKKLMYKMKLQEYTEGKQLKRMKDQFTDTINYLKSLIGLQKVTYDEISIQSLKAIKNAKIRQATQEVKELENIWQEKEIRNQELKQKIKEYQNQKNTKNQDNQQNLSQLRKDILTVQKQLNLHRNQLNAIYHMEEQKEKGNKQNNKTRKSTFSDQKKIENSNQKSSKQTDQTSKILEKSILGKSHQRSMLKIEKGANLQPRESMLTQEKIKNFTQNIFTTTSSNDEKLLQPLAKLGRHSLIRGMPKNSKIPMRAESFLMNRNSSQLLSKYAPILQHLRKQKYEQSLKQEMTKCEFQAEKQFENFKQEYTKACRQLRMVLNDCD